MRTEEMESVGSVIRRCLEATEFYRPKRPFRHGRVKQLTIASGQMILDFSEKVLTLQSTAITPENPITDEDVPF